MKSILCYGDSNTYGFNPMTGMRYDKNTRFSGVLASLLGEEYVVIEEGCNGRTTTHDDPKDGWKNGMGYLKPCLNSHKPLDLVILMLGTNDLKSSFGLTAKEIAQSTGELVDVILSFTKEKQDVPAKVLLISPPEIGDGIRKSAFNFAFDEDAITRSKEFFKYYKEVADEKGCLFLDAAKYAKASKKDSLHLMPEGHRALAKAIYEKIYN